MTGRGRLAPSSRPPASDRCGVEPLASSRGADQVLEAPRTGRGMGWGGHDVELFHAVTRGCAPLYRTLLTIGAFAPTGCRSARAG